MVLMEMGDGMGGRWMEEEVGRGRTRHEKRLRLEAGGR